MSVYTCTMNLAIDMFIQTEDMEDKEAIIKRIQEAKKYPPLENLWLSTQCGFASTEEGNILTEDDQWKKLALVKEIIDDVWKED